MVGAETIDEATLETLQIFRKLPDFYQQYARWAVNYQYKYMLAHEITEKTICIYTPKKYNDAVKATDDFMICDISKLHPSVRQKIFVGFVVIVDFYMPKYIPGDAILIANDRPFREDDDVLVVKDGYLWLVKYQDGNYYLRRNNQIIGHNVNSTEIIGYVAHVLRGGTYEREL